MQGQIPHLSNFIYEKTINWDDFSKRLILLGLYVFI